MNAPNIKQTAAAALGSIDAVLNRWLPGGKMHSHEYQAINPTRSDAKLGSFSINCNTGAWADFASDDKGGDLVALVAYLEGVKQGEAAKRLAEFLGMATEKTDPAKRATSDPKRAGNTITSPEANKPAWRALLPVPDGAPAPYATHPKHGKPSMRWEYHNEAGQLLCQVLRFDPKDEGERKQFFPLTFCEDETGKRAWRWQGLPEPRPLYRLNDLRSNVDAPVIVCEGEKAADAAALLFPDGTAVCTTMLNGAQAPHKTDWWPLAGRTVWLWADLDKAGRECMAKVAALAKGAGAASVEVFNLDLFARIPAGDDAHPELGIARPLPEKWDAADAVSDGWTTGHILLLMEQPDFLQPVSVPAAKVADTTRNAVADDASGEQLPHFHCNDKGVWYFGRNDEGNNMPPLWVCSKLEITASTRDAKNESWGRLLEFDDLDGTHHAWAMPMELLSGDGNEYRRMLLSMGLQIGGSSKARNLLTQYIQTAQVEQRARCVDRTGWFENVFVMPDRTIGIHDGERILFQSASATTSTFKRKGKLTDWQANVAALCAGNSRLVFAVSAAFAAPLLHVTGMESGGLHLRGDSSIGKTTALRAAASVLGGKDYVQLWRNTDNALEATAVQHSDCLLVLDEIGQVDAKIVGEVIYMLGNDKGKGRANRTGGLREPASWRILFLSSGEKTLSDCMMEVKKKPMAGQEARMLTVPADAGAGCGMFENMHQYANGEKFAMALTEAAGKHYGTAIQPFIEKLIEHSDKLHAWIKKTQSEFSHANVDEGAGGQVHRAALRFALIGAAGELATKWQITGWQPGEAMQAAVTCYKAWLAQRGGAGNLEELNMLAQVRRFFEAHGEARFTDWDRPVSNTDSHPPRTIQRAGYRRHLTNEKTIQDGRGEDATLIDTSTEYYVFPETFKQEVCAGFDYRVVCKLLVRHGCLMVEGKGYTRKERLPGGEGTAHCFRITHKLFSGGGDE